MWRRRKTPPAPPPAPAPDKPARPEYPRSPALTPFIPSDYVQVNSYATSLSINTLGTRMWNSQADLSSTYEWSFAPDGGLSSDFILREARRQQEEKRKKAKESTEPVVIQEPPPSLRYKRAFE